MTSIKQQMLERIRATGKSDETFKTYWYWCEKFFRFVRGEYGEWIHPSPGVRSGLLLFTQEGIAAIKPLLSGGTAAVKLDGCEYPFVSSSAPQRD